MKDKKGQYQLPIFHKNHIFGAIICIPGMHFQMSSKKQASILRNK